MRITEQEKLIAKVFDKSVEALGLMTKSICDSIKKDKQPELTKREHFAGLAMQALISNQNIKRPIPSYIDDGKEYSDFSKVAIEYADALLKQLETTQAD